MPLSEFLRRAIEKLESSKEQKSCPTHISSSRRESNIVEFVWENSPVHHSLSPRVSNEALGHESMFDSGTPSLDNGFEFSSIISNSSGSNGQDVVFGDVGSDLKMESCSNSLNFSHFRRPANLVKPDLPIPSSMKEKGPVNSMLIPRPQTDMEFYVPTGVNEPKEDGVASSVGSGNSGERVCYEQTRDLKRKSCDVESECQSDDIQTETVQGGSGSKRSRSAQVHNLSERRRRDRINEKMRTLQELIPNCNKADKASMLDEAIQYLKNLQHQVQLMSSMGSGICIPPMMLNPGSHNMYPAPIPHLSPMGIGMGMSYGNVNGGSPQRPILPLGVHSMVPKPPSTPSIGCHCASRISSQRNVPNPSEDPTTNKNSQKMLNAGATTSINRVSNQLQTTNEVGKKSSIVQENNQGSE